MELTRRHALAGAAGIAAAPLLPAVPAGAAAPAADRQAPSFYRYKVGDIMVSVVSDGKNVFKLEDAFIPNAKRDDVNAALDKAFMPRDMVTIWFAPLVLNTGGKLVVIDTGNGALAKASSKGANGLFADNFVAAANAAQIPLEVLHRVASMASGGLDTLPHNGAVITLLAVTGLTHRESYKDIFAITLIATAAAFFVIGVYYATGIV